ncbi:MAG: hypothetical protein ABI960_11225 [Candidatus Eisenbacteria bacterium]
MSARLARAALALFALVLLAAAPAVAADSKAPRLKKNQASIAPDFAAYRVVTIGMAPVTSIDHVEENEKLFRQAVESGFGPLDHYKFQASSYFIDAVRKAGMADVLAGIEKAAQDGAPIDTAAVAALRGKVALQAVLFSRLSTWQRLVVDPSTRGQSFTQVGADFALVSLKDGAVIWRGSFLEKGDGPYNDPGAGEVTERDAGGNSTARRAQLEPPSYREVLEKLLRRATAMLPPAAAPTPKPAP